MTLHSIQIKLAKLTPFVVALFVCLILGLGYLIFLQVSWNQEIITTPTELKEKITPSVSLLFTSPRVGEPSAIAFTTRPIVFQFDSPINPESVKASINPPLPFRLQSGFNDPTQLQFIPTQTWRSNQTYTLSISQIFNTQGESVLTEEVVLLFPITSEPPPVRIDDIQPIPEVYQP